MKLQTKPVLAWAWLCDFGLCKWAGASRQMLLDAGEKPSPEARAVCVEMRVLAEVRKRKKGRKG